MLRWLRLNPTVTIRANSANHDSKINYMVDKSTTWSIADFNNAKIFVFTYDKKYQINKVVFGNYCYHPDSAYGRLYYWNYNTKAWQHLKNRSKSDYAIRTYSFSTFETDKFLISCTTSRGYINEFRIYFQ